MSVFSADTVHRAVPYQNKEIILFSRNNRLFVDFAPRGTMMRAKAKRSLFWMFKHIGIIFSVILLSVFIYLISAFHGAFLILAIISLAPGVADLLFRAELSYTLAENWWNFSNDEYFSADIPVNSNIWNGQDLLREHMPNMSEEDFIDVCEKFSYWSEVHKASDALFNKLKQQKYKDTEVFEYAQTKLDEALCKVEENNKKFRELIRGLENNENEKNEEDLVKTLVKTEKLLAG